MQLHMKLVNPANVFKTLGLIVLLSAVYFLSGKLGLMLAFLQANATVVWPPAGIALAALLVFGRRLWPGIFIGAFLVNLTTEGTVLTSILIAVGNTLEAVVGAYLITHFANGIAVFEQPKTFMRFLFLGPVVSAAISATVGVTSLTLLGFGVWANYGAVWLTWWLGDAVSLIIIAPLLVLWISASPVVWDFGKRLEYVLLILVALGTSYLVFGGILPERMVNHPLSFTLLPVLLWSAFRFSSRESATVALIITGVSLWGTLHGFGPFVLPMQNESLVVLQAFIGISAIVAYSTASAVGELRRIQNALQDSEAHYRTLFEVSPEAILILRRNNISFANKASIKLLGALTYTQVVGRPALSFVLAKDKKRFEKKLQDIMVNAKAFSLSQKLLRLDGKIISARIDASPFFEHDAPSVRLVLRTV